MVPDFGGDGVTGVFVVNENEMIYLIFEKIINMIWKQTFNIQDPCSLSWSWQSSFLLFVICMLNCDWLCLADIFRSWQINIYYLELLVMSSSLSFLQRSSLTSLFLHLYLSPSLSIFLLPLFSVSETLVYAALLVKNVAGPPRRLEVWLALQMARC